MQIRHSVPCVFHVAEGNPRLPDIVDVLILYKHNIGQVRHILLPLAPLLLAHSRAVQLPQPLRRLIKCRQALRVRTSVLLRPRRQAKRNHQVKQIALIGRIDQRPLRVLRPRKLRSRRQFVQPFHVAHVFLFPVIQRQLHRHRHAVYFFFLRHAHTFHNVLVQDALLLVGRKERIQFPQHALIRILLHIHVIQYDYIRHFSGKYPRIQVFQRVFPADRIVSVHPRLISDQHIRVLLLEQTPRVADTSVLSQTIDRKFLRRFHRQRLVIVQLRHVIAAEVYPELPVRQNLQRVGIILAVPQRSHLPVRNLLDHRTAPHIAVQPGTAGEIEHF